MNKLIIISILLAVFITGFASCTKKESPAPKAEQSQMIPAHGDFDIQMPKAEDMTIIIPDDVKTRWKGVILTVIDKETMAVKDYVVQLSGRVNIPGTMIEIQTGEFLPDLKIDGNIYTTASAELLNPAVRVSITEEGKEIFKGWLFQKFPSVHPFKHQKYGITLKEPLDRL